MNNKIKYIATILFLIITSQILCSQERSHLPYSVFGIGELATQGFDRNIAMGKTGIALSSTKELNNLNPASYESIDSISFFFNMGMHGDIVDYRTHRYHQQASDVNINFLSIGFPITKRWKSSIGLVPFSTVGYITTIEKIVEGTTDYYDISIEGSGGVNKIYWGNSFSPLPRFHMGANMYYLFGSINNLETAYYSAFSGSIVSSETAYLNKIGFDFGFQYNMIQADKLGLTLGGTYGYKTPLNFSKELNVTDESSTTLVDEITYSGTYNFPMHFGAGVAVTLFNKVLITSDYEFYNWAGTKSQSSDYSYQDANNLRFGFEYLPSEDYRESYLKKITYRAGYYIEDFYLKINDVSTTNSGVTFGLNLPLPKTKTSINLSFVKGIQGSTENGLIKKDYSSFYLGLVLHDWWFIRSKFD